MVSPPPDVGNQPTASAPTAGRAAASTPERGAAPPGAAAPALDRADIKPLDVTAALQILIAEVRESFVRLLIEAGGTAAAGNQDDVGGGIGAGDVLVSSDVLAASDVVVAGDVVVSGGAGGVVDALIAANAGATDDAVATDDAGATGDAGAAPSVGGAVTIGHAPMTAFAGVAGAAWPPANLDSPTAAARVLVEMMLQALPATADEAAWSEALPRAEAALQSGVQRAVDVVSAWRDVPPLVVQVTRESAGLALQVLGDDPLNPLWLRPEWLTMTPRLVRFWRRRRILRRRLTDPDDDSDTRWDEKDGHAP